jgi:hypothetical protein
MVALGVTSLSAINPTISGLTYQSQTPVKYQSTLLSIYQDASKKETRYQPVQALQNCFRLVLRNERQ